MKITEIFDVPNNEINLILGERIYILIQDYDDYKNRLQEHNIALELLTRRVLNFSLFRNSSRKSKPSYATRNEKKIQMQRAKNRGVVNGELSIIKKLLSINLRSFKIMQTLFQESKQMQLLLNDSRIFAKKRKQKIEYAKRENERKKKKIEALLKNRLGSFFRNLNNVSKSFIAGFKNDYYVDCNSKVSATKDKTTNMAYRLHDEDVKLLNINRYQFDIVIHDLRIRLDSNIVELPSKNFFNISFEYMRRDQEIKYPLLMWQTEKSVESYKERSDTKELQPERKASYKIEKDIQNAIRLHCVNSSILKSFLLMKTIREFVMFHQIHELIKAFFSAGEACNEDPNSETTQTLLIPFDKLSLYSYVSESSSDYTIPSNLSLNELLEKTRSEETKVFPKKIFQRVKVFYSLKKIQKKVILTDSNGKKIKKTIPRKQYFLPIDNISIGIGDSCIQSVDKGCQVGKAPLVVPTFETDNNNRNINNFANYELYKEDSTIQTLYTNRRDYKKSLKSLEDVIKSCRQKCEQESTAKLNDKLRKKGFNNAEKTVNTQRKLNNTVKQDTNKKRNPMNYYNKDTRTFPELPAMSKMYQIILENRLPRGVSFEYLTQDKSKVQLLFVSNKSPGNSRTNMP